jgi:RNA polymerase sigma factor for flagellar operon FliA
VPPETKTAAKHPPTKAADEQRHLKSAAQRAYSSQKKTIDDDQIAQFLPMVHKIAQRVVTYVKPPLSYDDLVSAGAVGLVKAARDYDPSFQAEFKTYAYIRIKGAILDELRGWSFMPPNVNKQIRTATQASIEITRETGIIPDDTQLAEKLGVSLDELYQTFENARAQQFLSLDGLGEDAPALRNVLAAPNTTTSDQQLEHAELVDKLAEAIQQLEQRQRQLILLYYQQHLTMKQIAEIFNVTEPRVSQLHASALFNLFQKLREWDNDGK